MPLTQIKDGVIQNLNANKVTGAFTVAADGSQLTGLSAVDWDLRYNLAINYFNDSVKENFDRSGLDQGWVDVFKDTDDVDGEGVSVPMTRFDGVNDELNLASMSGIADGKEGTIAGWLNVNGTGVVQMILSNDSGFFQSRIQTTGKLLIDGSPNLSMTSIQNVGGIGLFHFMASWDLANTTGHLYINGIDDLEASPTFNNANIDYLRATTDWALGMAGPSDVDEFDGDMGQIYFDDSYIDLSIQANRELFVSGTGANAKPVDLGSNGEKPTGSRPKIYLNNPYGSFQTNLGTGGNFTVINGELVDGGYVNDKIYDSSTDSFSNSYEIVKSFGKENESGTANISAGRPEDKYGVVLTLSSEIILKKVGFYLRKQNSPVGDIWCEIHGVSGTPGTNGIANNNIIARSDKINTSLIGSSLTMQDFTFADLLILPADDYAITLNCSEVGDNINTIHMGVHNDPDTNRTVTSAGTWTWDFSINSSPIYYLYGQKNLDLITKGSDDIGNSPSTAPEKGHMEVLLTERPAGGTSTFSDTLSTDAGGWTSASFRQIISASSLSNSGERVRIKLLGGPNQPWKLDNVAIVERSGQTPHGVRKPSELFFGGASGCIAPVNGSIWSDWLDFSLDSNKDYLIVMDVVTDGNNDNTYYSTTGDGYYATSSSNTYGTAAMSLPLGWTGTTETYAVAEIQVENKQTLNTGGDIIGQMSRDGGTAWTDIPLKRIKTQVGGSPNNLLVGNATLTSTTGTNIVGRIKTANKDKITVQGISVNWS